MINNNKTTSNLDSKWICGVFAVGRWRMVSSKSAGVVPMMLATIASSAAEPPNKWYNHRYALKHSHTHTHNQTKMNLVLQL